MREFLFLIILFSFFLSNSFSAELFISAAMGTRELVSEIGNKFEKRTGNRVIFNFSSSGKLAKQIESGAPADVYISASKFWMDYLVRKGIVDKESVFPFAKTKLVLVVPKGSKITCLEEAGRIAVGDKLAPVGKYALETLKNLGLYEKIKEKLVFAPTVRQITIWVITKNADAGIIYYSDYLKFKDKLKLLKVFPENLHKPIMFYIGLVNASRRKGLSRRFEEFLISRDGKEFEKFGFFKIGGGGR